MSNRILVGTKKGLFDLRRTGAGWSVGTVHFLGDPVSAVLGDPQSGTLYAALALGHFGNKLWASHDDGRTWTERVAPAFPPKPEGTEDPHPWTVHSVGMLEPGGVPGRIWAGTVGGGLFRSDDHGESWILNRPLWDQPERQKWMGGGNDQASVHSICVHPANANDLVVGVSVGGAWRSRDAGATWSLIGDGLVADYMPPELQGAKEAQDPHRIVQARSNPDRLWCQHHNGIFRSDDRGTTWTRITSAKPSAFGFAVAVHPDKPDRAWFVPAVKDEKRYPVDGKLVVTRTDDAGKSFAVQTNGLPQQPAYDLVYRHALDIDGSGEGLAFGSTTGGVWVSENGGERWAELPARLPPIACLRFAA